jgi:hypothetical protein
LDCANRLHNAGSVQKVEVGSGKACHFDALGDGCMNAVAMQDLASLAAQSAVRLKERQHTLTVAESSAGGLISAAVLAVPGASAY